MNLVKRIDGKAGCQIAMVVLAFAFSAVLWTMTGKWPTIFVLPGLSLALVSGAALTKVVAKRPRESIVVIIVLILITAYVLFLAL
ncbi:MAG: hypothetical protein PHI88_01650 [Candidatus Pacebacteria bacterium]|nr:hypothetical protein [Candidatus Paceibacterota bacterium]